MKKWNSLSRIYRISSYVRRKIRGAGGWNTLRQATNRHWAEIGLVVAFLGSFNENNVLIKLMTPKTNTEIKREAEAMNTSLINHPDQMIGPPANLANTYSNMYFSEGEIATDDTEAQKTLKRQKQEAYVQKFSAVARKEFLEYGIPPSITLAQGLLESNVGESKLATQNNNHFGIKCFSRKCKRGHCSNFEDDSHKDFFRIFQSAEESYRAHSILLQKKRYQNLFRLEKSDYQGWAHGLKKAGYATDPHYAYKIINLIDDLELYKYDSPAEEEACD